MSLNNEPTQAETGLKGAIVSATTTFGGAFKATLGFYAAQTVATVLGLSTFAALGLVIYCFFKFL